METVADKLQKLINGKQYVIDKINAKAGSDLKIDSTWQSVGDTVENIQSGGNSVGIEEVTELPEANSENVGKIYKYQGQLYECKEFGDLGAMGFPLGPCAGQGSLGIKVILCDTEPNIEDMEESTQTYMIFYILRNGSDGWMTVDGMKLSVQESGGQQIKGVVSKYTDMPNDGNYYLVRYYVNTLINNDIIVSMLDMWSGDNMKSITVPANVTCVRTNVFANSRYAEIVFEGNPFRLSDNVFAQSQLLTTIDLSNCTKVPKIGTNCFDSCESLTTIKVPQALLEEFKSATNWSDVADKIVGV